MKLKIVSLILNGTLQIGGCIVIGHNTNWIVGVAVFCVIWGHNIDKKHTIGG